MKRLAVSIITSIAFGLLVYWSYRLAVTGLSLIALAIVELVVIGLLFLTIGLIKKSDNKMLAILGLLLFGVFLPFGLVVTKIWNVDKTHVRQYHESQNK